MFHTVVVFLQEKKGKHKTVLGFYHTGKEVFSFTLDSAL